jgi:hypothetical protein
MFLGGRGFEVVKYNLLFCCGSLNADIQFIFLHAGFLGQLGIDNSHACCGTILEVQSAIPCRVAHTVRYGNSFQVRMEIIMDSKTRTLMVKITVCAHINAHVVVLFKSITKLNATNNAVFSYYCVVP